MAAHNWFVGSLMPLAVASCGRPTQAPAPAAAAPSAAPTVPTQTDTVQRSNDDAVQQVMASIAGREQEPASRVFTNVKYLADVPARTFLQIMNVGYAKALGVSCTHCHVEGNYGADDKRPKR